MKQRQLPAAPCVCTEVMRRIGEAPGGRASAEHDCARVVTGIIDGERERRSEAEKFHRAQAEAARARLEATERQYERLAAAFAATVKHYHNKANRGGYDVI